jgi:hypothetical protein
MASTAPRRVASPRPDRGVGRTTPSRPPLRVVPTRRAGRGRGRIVRALPAAMVVVALLVVVVGQAMLADGQVRLSGREQQLQTVQAEHRQEELDVLRLETPSRIVATATGRLHMVASSHVTQLPYVSLSTPLPTPVVTPLHVAR